MSSNLADPDAKLAQAIEAVPESEDDAFHHGAGEVGPGVMGA